MQSPTSEPRPYHGCAVVDAHGREVGMVADVLYDDADVGATQEPTWLVVDPGILRAAHCVPVAGSFRSGDGAVVVPWERSWITSAPKAKGDHVITPGTRDELVEHYDVAHRDVAH